MYSTRLFESGDEIEIVPLLDLIFDGWPHLDLPCSPLDHWRWKYKENPTGILGIAVAISNGRIIGCFHVIPGRMKILDKVILCMTGADLAVNPDYRGIGVSTRIRDLLRTQYPELGIKHAYFVTGNPILVKSYKKNRPVFPHKVTNLVRIKDVGMHLRAMPVKNSLLLRLGYHSSKSINDLKNIFKKRNLNNNFDVYDTKLFNDNFDDFWEKISCNYDFINERKSKYLNWRYCDPRGGNYIVKVVEEKDDLLGYCVLNINRYLEDYPIGYILDLLALPGRTDAAESLIYDAVRFFDEERINLINYLIPRGHPYQKLLGKFGFLDSRIKIHMFYNTFSDVDEISNIRNIPADRIYFSWGDLDMLPVSAPVHAFQRGRDFTRR